jgi:hypothetical protein
MHLLLAIGNSSRSWADGEDMHLFLVIDRDSWNSRREDRDLGTKKTAKSGLELGVNGRGSWNSRREDRDLGSRKTAESGLELGVIDLTSALNTTAKATTLTLL